MKKARPPVRSVAELAREFGVSPQKLGAMIQNDPDAPAPVATKGDGTTTVGVPFTFKKAQYDHAAMKAWWEARNKGSA